MKFPSRYNVIRDDSVGRVLFQDETRAKQSFKKECDINTIMAKYQSSGVLPSYAGPGLYGDFSQVSDFLEAQVILQHAEEQFKGLSSAVRDRFKNDPAEFLAFVNNPKNKDEAIKLGLVEVPAPPAPPMKVEVVNPPGKEGKS